MTNREFRLPDVGEGLAEAEIVTWRVAPGDVVTHNQVLVEIETAKSLVELPSPFEGTVTELLVPEGRTVPVGTPIIVIGTGVGGDVTDGEAPTEAQRPSSAPHDVDGTGEPGAGDGAGVAGRPTVLVGYGPAEQRRSRRRRRTPLPHAPAGEGAPAAEQRERTPYPPAVRAKPPVRKLAKDLGVDVTTVAGSGPDGAVTRRDVLEWVEGAARRPQAVNGTVAPAAAEAQVADPAATEHPVGAGHRAASRVPIRGVRKATAAAMTASAFTAPHVTEFLTVDVTRSVRLVEKLRADPAFAGSRVTMLLMAAKALLAAVRAHPEINASWDGEAGEIVRYERVGLGIAVTTPRGLMVPNIKAADTLALPGLAAALTELIQTAWEGRSTPGDLTGGTITITNIGTFGVDAGTPILNPGEAAILCLGAVRETPWVHRGRVAPRSTTQLAVSFDHRLVDGELGSRVLARVGRVLENPRWELLLG